MKYNSIKTGMWIKRRYEDKTTTFIYINYNKKNTIDFIEFDCRSGYSVYKQKNIDSSVYYFDGYTEITTYDEFKIIINRVFDELIIS